MVSLRLADGNETVPVCTSDTESDVKELSGTLVEKGDGSDEVIISGAIRVSSVISTAEGAVWISTTSLLDRSRAVTDTVELVVEQEVVRVSVPGLGAVWAGPT